MLSHIPLRSWWVVSFVCLFKLHNPFQTRATPPLISQAWYTLIGYTICLYLCTSGSIGLIYNILQKFGLRTTYLAEKNEGMLKFHKAHRQVFKIKLLILIVNLITT